MSRTPSICIAALFVLLTAAGPAVAQQVTRTDVDRLRDTVFEAATDLARLRTGDAALLGALRAQLNALRARVASFEIASRGGKTVVPADYAEVRDGIETVRRRARGDETANARNVPPSMTPLEEFRPPQGGLELPAGTEIEVRLLTLLDPSIARVDDRIETVTPADLRVNGQVVLPAGTLLRGVVTYSVTDSVTSVARADGRVRTLSVRFDYLTVDYRAYPIRASLGRRMLAIGGGSGGVLAQPGSVLRIRLEAPVFIHQPAIP